MHPITEILVNGEKVGYYIPLYNKPEYRFTPADKWYVNINYVKEWYINKEKRYKKISFFLIEKRDSKKSIIEAIENYFKKYIENN